MVDFSVSGSIVSRLIWTVAVALVLPAVATVAADPTTDTDQARELVGEALYNEIYGHGEMRAKLLAEACQADPDFLPAKWHQGLVRFRGQWTRADEVPRLAAQDPVLSEYRLRRAKAKRTVDDQLALAKWCRNQGLVEQERAHLFQTLSIDPRNAPAHKRLGFKRVGDVWVSRSELEQLEQSKKARRAAIDRWAPKFRTLARDVRGRHEKQRTAALAEIRKISDPDAIPALEEILSSASQPAAMAVVDALATIPGVESSHALTRQALLSSWPEVRGAAARRLKKRPLRDFVPLVLDTMRLPATTTTQLALGSLGTIRQRVLVQQEGHTARDVAVVDKAYRTDRVGRMWVDADPGTSLQRALQFDAAARSFVRRTNMAVAAWNQRVGMLLSTVSGRPMSDDPGQWWNWWTQETERQEPVGNQKPVRSYYVRNVDYVRLQAAPDAPSNQVPAPATTSECLAKGTLVHTMTGLVPIEQVEVGDLVLAQDPDSGRLAYKPVAATTTRAAEPLVRLGAGTETFTTTGGHLFWVAGDGWVKARRLRSGMQLHTVDGPVPVRSVELAETAVTYNLVVPDFNTFFVGKQAVLSHDFNKARPTSAVVPGLAGVPR